MQHKFRRHHFQQKNHNRANTKRFGTAKDTTHELVRAIQASKIGHTQRVVEQAEYVPQHSFNDFAIAQELKNNIAQKGYTTPTPIQDQTISTTLSGRDVIGIANTGTGKTAAFLIPLVNKVIHNRSEQVLIIAPTRELAVQIYDELRSFARGLNIYAALCIGGASMHRQRQDLQRNPQFVIGTPGRIKDHIREKQLNLQQFHSVVLDETDRMVDIGFIHDIKYFISLLPENRQSLFFSATISDKVKDILQSFVRNPVTISVRKQQTSANIAQDVIKVTGKEQKMEHLQQLLTQKEFEKVLIFGRTKWGVQKLTNQLVKKGFRAGVIHGNKKQSQRQRTLDEFKRNKITILLATDVASRGLDIDNVSHVINYDVPATYEDYVHRIGRTGRANKLGTALTFVE